MRKSILIIHILFSKFHQVKEINVTMASFVITNFPTCADSNTIYKNSRGHLIGKMCKKSVTTLYKFLYLLICVRSIMHEIFKMHFLSQREQNEGKQKKRKRRGKLPVFILNYVMAFCIMGTLSFLTGNGVCEGKESKNIEFESQKLFKNR